MVRAVQIFAPNPFFKNTEIIKSFRVVEEALESQTYNIDWLPVCSSRLQETTSEPAANLDVFDEQGRDVTRNVVCAKGGKGKRKRSRDEARQPSFFLWFSNEASFDENRAVDDFLDLHQRPFLYYGHSSDNIGEEQGAEMAAASQPNEDDSDSDDSDYESPSESEQRKKYHPPSWARGAKLQAALAAQEHVNPDTIFRCSTTVDLEKIFGEHHARPFRRRTSSANWKADHTTWTDRLKYNQAMGFTTQQQQQQQQQYQHQLLQQQQL